MNKTAKIIVCLFLYIYVIPTLLSFILVNTIRTKFGAPESWLGFWGSYLGSLLTIGGAMLVFIWERKERIKSYRPTEISVKFNWNFNKENITFIFSGLNGQSGKISELTKDFSSLDTLTRENIPTLLNFSPNNLYGVIIFATIFTFDENHHTEIKGTEALTFPKLSADDEIWLLFPSIVNNFSTNPRKKEYIQKIEVYGHTSKNEIAYYEIPFSPDILDRDNIPLILHPRAVFNDSNSFPTSRINYLIKNNTNQFLNTQSKKLNI